MMSMVGRGNDDRVEREAGISRRDQRGAIGKRLDAARIVTERGLGPVERLCNRIAERDDLRIWTQLEIPDVLDSHQARADDRKPHLPIISCSHAFSLTRQAENSTTRRGNAVSAQIPSVEVSWFSALCDDDYEFLGVPDERLRSSYEHCRDIVITAEHGGFDNILLPSGYQLGIDSIAFAGAVAPLLKRIRLLVAVRCGEMWPPQLARQLATLDRMLDGRLTVNIISSELPGQPLATAPRYQRCVEVMQILRTLLDGEALDFAGEFYQLKL